MSGYTLVGLNRKRVINSIHFKHVKGSCIDEHLFGYTFVNNEASLMYL